MNLINKEEDLIYLVHFFAIVGFLKKYNLLVLQDEK